MANPLDLFPARVRFVDQNGLLTTEAFKALRALFERVGGLSAPSNNELAISDDDDSGLEEFKAESAKTLGGLAMTPVAEPIQPAESLVPLPFEQIAPTETLQPLPQEVISVQELETQIAGLREQVAAMASHITALQQGTTP